MGGRLKRDPPSLLLFGCTVGEEEIKADAYLVLHALRKGTKPRLKEIGGKVTIPFGLKPGYIIWEPIQLKRDP